MRDPYTCLVAGVVFPMQELLKGHDSVNRRRALERSQCWSREELLRHRIQHLKELLTHAAMHVPYYRKLLSSRAFNAGEVRSLEALPTRFGRSGRANFVTS